MGDGRSGVEDGFAAVDALTALVILSTTITLSIGALSVARRAERAASEAATARSTLQFLLAEPVRTVGMYSGSNLAFDWTLQVDAEGAASAPVRVCVQRLSARSRASGKTYGIESRRPCAPQTPTS